MSAVIEKDWFKVWVRSQYPPTVPEFGVILSAYSPYLIDDSERENVGRYTTFLTFGVFKEKGKYNIILFSMFEPAILTPSKMIGHAQNLCHDYINNGEVKLYEGSSPDILLVPAQKDVRASIHAKLGINNNNVTLRKFFYENYGKNLDNLLVRVLPRIEEGRVWVAASPIELKKASLKQEQDDVNRAKLNADSLSDVLRSVDKSFLVALCSYPFSEEVNSVVWCLVQTLMFLEIKGVFSGNYHVDGSIKPKNNFYGLAS